MDNIILEAFPGATFSHVAEKAKSFAVIHKSKVVEFDFNGCTCLVKSNTNLDGLFRDYLNSWAMGWKVVGPDCVSEYSQGVKNKLEKRKKKIEEERELERIEYKKKEDAEKLVFTNKTKDIEIELSNKEDWELGKSKNTDGYGGGIYEYAEGWAKLMQLEISSGNKLEDIAEKTSLELGFLGITGYMYGAAIQVLSKCWKYGEELRKWHNKEYNHEGEGVVNPAVFVIN